MKIIKTYSECIQLPTFLDRFRYLQIGGYVGKETFGYDRYLNQILYQTSEWKSFRRKIILRDKGCDLACEGYDITGTIIVHHINPITVEDVLNRDPTIFDPDNAICTTLNTHNAIHYSDETKLITEPIVRTKNDTCPWKH